MAEATATAVVDNSRQQFFIFTHHSSVSSFATSSSLITAPETYLSNYPGIKCNYTATGALVFDSSDSLTPRILLIQRSKTDTLPSLWEFPGGSCDDDDLSILHAVARELWEETGLNATKIGPLVGMLHFFLSRSGRLACRFNFLVEVERDREVEGSLEVKLDPAEHQRFVWASEGEVRAKKVGGVDLKFTSREVECTVLEAFKSRGSELV
ncbi:hypothetical protein B7463_g12318, partial [Scytalidium lignicola]